MTPITESFCKYTRVFMYADEFTPTLILNKTQIECMDANSLANYDFYDLTNKGYRSRKQKDTGIELNVVARYTDEEGDDIVELDKEQMLNLLLQYHKEYKVFETRRSTMDATTAFALAGNKYGWIYDRIDEQG